MLCNVGFASSCAVIRLFLINVEKIRFQCYIIYMNKKNRLYMYVIQEKIFSIFMFSFRLSLSNKWAFIRLRVLTLKITSPLANNVCIYCIYNTYKWVSLLGIVILNLEHFLCEMKPSKVHDGSRNGFWLKLR